MAASEDTSHDHLAALRSSIQLAIEVEGPKGGPFTIEQLEHASWYYALHYGAFAPAQLAGAVHLTRSIVADLLAHDQTPTRRTELRRIAGDLSAVLGNLAFHLADYTAARLHLGVAVELGKQVGLPRLTAWSLGAQSMVARYQDRAEDALAFATQAMEHADTPFRRAQILGWVKIPALAALQDRSGTAKAEADANSELETNSLGEQPGRFGYDLAEHRLHLAEAHLMLGDWQTATTYATESITESAYGRPSWIAANLTLARAQNLAGYSADGAELALTVLNTVPGADLRTTSRQRLAALDSELTDAGFINSKVTELRELVAQIPAPRFRPHVNPENP